LQINRLNEITYLLVRQEPAAITKALEKAGVEFTNGKRPEVRLKAPRAKRTQHRKNENLRPRLIAGGAGKLGRGLAQPSDDPTLRLPDVILAFSEWQLKQASNLARMEASCRGRRGSRVGTRIGTQLRDKG
jgi:hypothetical protein